MKEWAIRQFGSNDKAILIGSVLLGVLVFAAIAGLLARRRFALGAGCWSSWSPSPPTAALTRPAVGRPRRRAQPGHRRGRRRPPVVARPTGRAVPTPRPARDAADDRPHPPRDRQPPRRARRHRARWPRPRPRSGGAGRWIIGVPHPPRGHRPPGRRRPGPAAAHGPRRPGPRDLDLPHLQRRLLPRRHPARRCRSSTPTSWTLTIDGDVDQELTFTFDDLLGDAADRARHHPDLRLQRASAARYVGAARWLGVRAQGPARHGRHRQHEGRPDPQHRRRRDDDQHPARRWPPTAATR